MGNTIVHGNFEWDSEKAKENIRKHGISFEEVLSIFDDPFFLEEYDFEHSDCVEQRYRGIGRMNGITVVISTFAERKSRTRIINARITTKEEERKYEEWCKQFFS